MANNMRRLTPGEMRLVTDGERPSAGRNAADFFAWVGCGFHHRYAFTGKTLEDAGRVFPVRFYQVKCLDCGHISWTRTKECVLRRGAGPDLMPGP